MPKLKVTKVSRAFTCKTCGTPWKHQLCCPRCDRQSKHRTAPDKDPSFQSLGDGHYVRKVYGLSD